MFALKGLLTATALAAYAAAQQVAFDTHVRAGGGASRTGGSFGLRPEVNATVSTRPLASVTSQDAFVALAHPRFPAHQVRVKKSDFCDPTVK